MTYRQHWVRGIFVSAVVGVAGLSAAIAATLIAGILVIFPLELLGYHPNEDTFYFWAAGIGAIAWMPLFVSQGLDKALVPGSPRTQT